MGIYLNPSNDAYKEAQNSKIYIDKTGLIQYTNSVIFTLQKYICVSRPRRFGKSMTANMLASYYSCGCDSREVFEDKKIREDISFEKYLNQYNVIFINMQEFLSTTHEMDEMLDLISKSVIWDLLSEYPDVRYFDEANMNRAMQDVYSATGRPYVVIIDEWDCVFREYKEDSQAQKQYLDFLRNMLKDRSYIHLAYMTGILPIKKYGTHSALNMFDEFSMTNPKELTEYVGFTEEEVESLCCQYGMDMGETKAWYDGYTFGNETHIYSPRSVVSCMLSKSYDNFWNQTETFEALRVYIDMNFDGLKDDIVSMMSGRKVPVNTGSFSNDMTTFHIKDDVLTLLIHLGYLGYDFDEQRVYIPNNEILNEYDNAIRTSDWGGVTEALKNSRLTLDAILRKDAEKTAEYVERAHYETTHIQYNDENALSYTISLALYSARNYYTTIRELPTGRGFADIVYLPRRKFCDKPAIFVELKWNQSAEGAIAQIQEKNYPEAIKDFSGKILLVGINYDKRTRKHICKIEEISCV